MLPDDRENYHWRETYFVLFQSRRRPTLTQIERTLGEINAKYQLVDLTADEDGLFESLTLRSPDDHAMLEITFESGDAVTEQAAELADQLGREAEPEQLATLRRSDARLDLMHFEQLSDDVPADEDEMEEMLDPSCLLMVVDALIDLTDGVPVDPASGTILP